MSWTTDEVSYQCPTIDSVQKAIAANESELANVEGHLDTARDAAEEALLLIKEDEIDVAEVEKCLDTVIDEMNDGDIDARDAIVAVEDVEGEMESIRTACEGLRNMAESQQEDLLNEKIELEEQLTDLTGDQEELQEAHDILEMELREANQRIQELEGLLNPMLPIPFKTVGPSALEVWNKSLGVS